MSLQLLKTKLRSTVSADKRRFQQDGYDLDLCYINERIIGKKKLKKFC